MYGSRSDGGKLPAELLIKPPIRLSLSLSLSLSLFLAHTKEGRRPANRGAKRRSDVFPGVAELD